MDIATGLSALKTSTDLLRSLRDRLKSGEVKGEEVIGRIGEIYDYIVESKDALVDVKDEIYALKEKLRAATRKYESRFGTLWRLDDAGNTLGPYCSICAAEGKELPMKPLNRAPAGEGQAIPMTCPILHLDGRMQRPLYYMIPREVIPENWICPE